MNRTHLSTVAAAGTPNASGWVGGWGRSARGRHRARRGPSLHRTPFKPLQYMAPEMFEGGPLTPAVDQWAFGALLYEMAAGEAPWAGLATPMQAGEGWMGWVG